jgi:hypothetical protein
MNNRKFIDRRKKTIKNFPNDRRAKLRRSEDKKNLVAYYITLVCSFGLLIAMGIASYLY